MNDLNLEFERIKAEINEYPLEIDKGTKKMIAKYHQEHIIERNKLVNKYLKKYNKLNEDVINELKLRKENLTPFTDINVEELNDSNKQIRDVVLFINKLDTNNKLLITNYLNQLSFENNNLNNINECINSLLEVFKLASIDLNIEDFKFSTSVYNYMNCFLKNYKNDKFNDLIKEKFERVYYLCPNIINHLKLCFYLLSIKYKKKLDKYAIEKNEELIKVNKLINKNPLDEYKYLIRTTNNLYNKDEFLLTKGFIDGSISPDDYLKGSNNRINKLNKYLNNMTIDDIADITKYYKNIEELDYALEEYNNYLFFKPFIDDLKKRMSSTDKNALKNKNKEFMKIEKERLKHVSKIFKKIKSGKKIEQEMIFKENEIITRLNNSYNELIDITISTDISTNITDMTNLKEILTFIVYNYDYFVKLYNKINDEDLNMSIYDLYDKLVNFVYSPYNSIIENINLASSIDIPDIIASKYQLLNLNITKENINESLPELLMDLEYILRIYYIEDLNIDFKNYSIINKIKKITK